MEAELLPVNVSHRSNAPLGLRYFEPRGFPPIGRCRFFFSKTKPYTLKFYHAFLVFLFWDMDHFFASSIVVHVDSLQYS